LKRRSIQSVVGKAERKRLLWRPEVYKRVILKFIFRKIGFVGVEYIQLAQHRIQWWTVVNRAMNIQAP
jgi:hypothetical protein